MLIRWLFILLAGALSLNAAAFEVGEFRNGLTRGQVKEMLTSWRFDRVQDSAETLLAYDLPEKNSNRSFRFHFCNDRLVTLEQAMKASVRNFIVITNNYLGTYGQPMRVDAGINVISSGEKNGLTINWRKGNDIIGVRYQQLPGGEALAVVYEVSNTCWQTPRPQ